MAYFKISTDKKGKLKAKIQALGRDPETDKQKVCYKLVKNDNDLTPAKFHKYVEKCAIEFEEELAKAYELKTDVKRRGNRGFRASACRKKIFVKLNADFGTSKSSEILSD